jgi:hypothetical protein
MNVAGTPKGKTGYSDRTINRMIARLKTFAKWIRKLKLFPLGNPIAKLKLIWGLNFGFFIQKRIPKSLHGLKTLYHAHIFCFDCIHFYASFWV